MNKRIAFLINSMGDGGAEKVVKILLENLYIDEFDIELICLEKNNIYNLNNKIKVTYLSNRSKSSGFIKLLTLPILSYRLNKYIKFNNINIVQSHLFRANYINILSKILFRGNHIVQIVNHSVISRYGKEALLGKINLCLINVLYPFANKILSVSNIVENDMQQLFNFKNKKEIIYNPFELDKIKKLSKEKITDFTFSNKIKYIISVGRLIKIKRNKDLILALSRLDKTYELLFIGLGSEKINLIKLAKDLNLIDRVHFLGWVDNPYKYMNHSNVLVNASETESFGNVIIEAMASATPVISTKCGGPEEFIQNDINGLLIDIGDVNNLVSSIKLICENSDIQQKYIINSFKSIKFVDIKNSIDTYKRVLTIE